MILLSWQVYRNSSATFRCVFDGTRSKNSVILADRTDNNNDSHGGGDNYDNINVYI